MSHSPSLGDSNSVQLGCGSGMVSHKLHVLNMQLGLEAIGVLFRISQLEGDCSSMISDAVMGKEKRRKSNQNKLGEGKGFIWLICGSSSPGKPRQEPEAGAKQRPQRNSAFWLSRLLFS